MTIGLGRTKSSRGELLVSATGQMKNRTSWVDTSLKEQNLLSGHVAQRTEPYEWTRRSNNHSTYSRLQHRLLRSHFSAFQVLDFQPVKDVPWSVLRVKFCSSEVKKLSKITFKRSWLGFHHNSLFPAHQSQTKYFRKTFRQMYLWPHQLQKTNDKKSNLCCMKKRDCSTEMKLTGVQCQWSTEPKLGGNGSCERRLKSTRGSQKWTETLD